jgi:hypothetical protein
MSTSKKTSQRKRLRRKRREMKAKRGKARVSVCEPRVSGGRRETVAQHHCPFTHGSGVSGSLTGVLAETEPPVKKRKTARAGEARNGNGVAHENGDDEDAEGDDEEVEAEAETEDEEGEPAEGGVEGTEKAGTNGVESTKTSGPAKATKGAAAQEDKPAAAAVAAGGDGEDE